MKKYLTPALAVIAVIAIVFCFVFNGQKGDLQKLADFIKTLKTVDRVEVLPYHSLGVPKYEKMGIKYTLDGVTAPSDEQIARAKEILGITV